jgi:ATP-binding protein involved in chromosome partitioning
MWHSMLKPTSPNLKILVVTTPHVNASHVAVKAGIGAQNIGHEVIGVVENMSYYLNPCNQKREFIFGSGGGDTVAKKLGVHVLGQVPIGQPQNGDYLFTGQEEAGKIYNEIAVHKSF